MYPSQKDYYALLGVLRDASEEEIKRAYFEAAQRLHPDKNKLAGETEIFLEVQKAYEVLSNPKRRAQYDATLPKEERTPEFIQNKVQYSRPNLVHLTEPQLVYVLLETGPHQTGEKLPTPPLNICLVLDRSTSMQGEKIDVAKAAATHIIQTLRAEDIFSMVTFSDRAEVLIPSAYQSERSDIQAQRSLLAAGRLHRAGRYRPALGEARQRRRLQCVRLVEGPVRALLADQLCRPARFDDRRSAKSRARDGGHDANEEGRHSGVEGRGEPRELGTEERSRYRTSAGPAVRFRSIEACRAQDIVWMQRRDIRISQTSFRAAATGACLIA